MCDNISAARSCVSAVATSRIFAEKAALFALLSMAFTRSCSSGVRVTCFSGKSLCEEDVFPPERTLTIPFPISFPAPFIKESPCASLRRFPPCIFCAISCPEDRQPLGAGASTIWMAAPSASVFKRLRAFDISLKGSTPILRYVRSGSA